MPASKTNYLVVNKGDSQVLGTANKDIALSTPPPEGHSIEDKYVVFIAFEPDTCELIVRPIPREEVLNAEIKHKKTKSISEDEMTEILGTIDKEETNEG